MEGRAWSHYGSQRIVAAPHPKLHWGPVTAWQSEWPRQRNPRGRLELHGHGSCPTQEPSKGKASAREAASA